MRSVKASGRDWREIMYGWAVPGSGDGNGGGDGS